MRGGLRDFLVDAPMTSTRRSMPSTRRRRADPVIFRTLVVALRCARNDGNGHEREAGRADERDHELGGASLFGGRLLRK